MTGSRSSGEGFHRFQYILIGILAVLEKAHNMRVQIMYTVELFVVIFHTSPFPLLSSVANIKSARSIVWQDHAVIVRVADTESWTGMQTLMHSRVVKGQFTSPQC